MTKITAEHISFLSTANERRSLLSAVTQRRAVQRSHVDTVDTVQHSSGKRSRPADSSRRESLMTDLDCSQRGEMLRHAQKTPQKSPNQARTVHHMSGQSGEHAVLTARQPFLRTSACLQKSINWFLWRFHNHSHFKTSHQARDISQTRLSQSLNVGTS